MSVDPIILTIFHSRLEAIATEMSHVLRRTAYSPNIKERADFSCAIFDEVGDLLAQAEAIPVHLGSMPFVAKPILEIFDDLNPGDAIVTNSPRPGFGGTHLPDITLLSPIFSDGNLCFIVANRAHHADVGGLAPGSLPASSTEIFQEGLIIPPVKLYSKGRENEDIMRLIMENVRTPYERRGDLRAQYSSLQLGVRRIQEMIEEHPKWDIGQIKSELLENSKLETEKLLSQYPSGETTFTDFLDDDGTGKKIAITCKITLDKGKIIFDFRDTKKQSEGNCNAPLSVTTSACYYVVRLLTGRTVPTNAGCFEPVEVITNPSSVVNPSPNAATSSANTETSQRIVDVLLGGLGKLISLPAASQGTMNNLLIGGVHNNQNWSIYETIGGGTGAGPNGDGCSAIQSHMTNTENTPIEALELTYPLRVRKYAIRPNSGGNGDFQGGDGIIREIELLDKATINIQSERRKFQPYGINNAGNGQSGKNIIKFPVSSDKDVNHINDDSNEDNKDSRILVENAPPGTIVRIETPGGGGWSE